MKKMYLSCCCALLLAGSFGCQSTNSAPQRKNSLLSSAPTDYGITVDIYENGRCELFRRPIKRSEIAAAVLRECDGRGYQRVVILAAKDPDVHRADLIALRNELVRAGIPRVILRTARNIYVETEEEDYEKIEAAYREATATQAARSAQPGTPARMRTAP